MSTEYLRIPLVIDARFMTDGTFVPHKLFYNGVAFEITKVLRKRRYCPTVVSCIAPVEYTVMIEGAERRIYYEADTNTWFSVKEVYIDDDRKSNSS